MSDKRIPRILQKDLEEAEDVDFTEEEEHWNIYKLNDGTTLKIKIILRGVKRLNKWRTDGIPVYLTNLTTVLREVNVPKELRRKSKPSTFKPV